jgi:hypothetical protein
MHYLRQPMMKIVALLVAVFTTCMLGFWILTRWNSYEVGIAVMLGLMAALLVGLYVATRIRKPLMPRAFAMSRFVIRC